MSNKKLASIASSCLVIGGSIKGNFLAIIIGLIIAICVVNMEEV